MGVVDTLRWILDDGPLDSLAEFGRPETLSNYPPERLLVAPTTSRQSSPSRSDLLRITTSAGAPLFQVFDVFEDQPAGQIFLELHGEERTTTNAAERESIAYALTDASDAVFVTSDKRAAITALAELGRSRVAHPFDLWIDLLENKALTAAEFRGLCERTKGRDQGLERMPGRIVERFVRK